jgi:hypothetical protein
MASGRQKRAGATASNAAANAEEAMQSPQLKAKGIPSHAYKKTRSQNKDLSTQQYPSSSPEAKETAEKDEKNPKIDPAVAPTTAAHEPPTTVVSEQPEPATTDPTAPGNDEDTKEIPVEATEKHNKTTADANLQDNTNTTTSNDLENKNFNPAIFRTATTTLQDTLALMNAKASLNTHISCDDLDAVYKQFDVFISSHPTLAPVVHPMVTAAAAVKTTMAAAVPQPQAEATNTTTNTAGGGNSSRDGNIAGVVANLSSMLSDLENSVLAAAAAAGSGGEDGEKEALPAGAELQQQAVPQLKAGWDAASLLQLQPALASALSDRLRNNNNNQQLNQNHELSGDGTATMTATTLTTQGGNGSAETTVLQDKIKRAIVAAQAGYHNNNNNNFNFNTSGGGAAAPAAATYNPGMSSQLQGSHQYNQFHYNPNSQMQSTLASGSPEHYYQPSAADSAAIAAATAAALAGQSRAGVDKTPALELLRALSNINYKGEGPSMMNNNALSMYTNRNTQNNNTRMFAVQEQLRGQRSSWWPYGAGGGGGSEEYFEEDEMERSRSPTPTINPNTNRPLRKVVVQKAADELAASALVSLGAMAGGSGGAGAAPTSRGNKFNRNGIKRTAATANIYERRYDEYHMSYSDGGGAAGGGGPSKKRKSPSKSSGGGGGSGQRGTTPQQTGGPSDTEVTAKVQLLMLMAQNLGEIQNPANTKSENDNAAAPTDAAAAEDGGGGGGGDEESPAVTRAMSEDGPIEEKVAV